MNDDYKRASLVQAQPIDEPDWPVCPVPDCGNRVCLWANTGRCHPCSVRLVGRIEMDRRYDATRAPGSLQWNGEPAT